MKSNKFFISLILATALLCPIPSLPSENDKQDSGDKAFAEKIEKKIKAHKKITIDYLKVKEPTDGHIIIEGRTELYASKYYAQQIAESFAVSSIDNQIIVASDMLRNDSDIERELFTGIRREIRDGYFDDVSFKVTNGVVLLFGKIKQLGLINKIMEVAIWTPAVRYVENNLVMYQVSSQDDTIRTIILKNYKRDIRTSQYFIGSYPQIIIVVEGGKVILKGFVNSNADKMIMGQIAQAVIGVLNVDNQLEYSK